MGMCHGRPIGAPEDLYDDDQIGNKDFILNPSPLRTPNNPFGSPSPLPSAFKTSPATSSSVSSTPSRFFKRLPPPSPAKHIKALLTRRHTSVKPNEATIPEGSESKSVGLDKNFGFAKNFGSHYDLGEELGKGHFGYTCCARGKKGSLKGQHVAVKVIPKTKMTTAIAIEDVRREVKILRA